MIQKIDVPNHRSQISLGSMDWFLFKGIDHWNRRGSSSSWPSHDGNVLPEKGHSFKNGWMFAPPLLEDKKKQWALTMAHIGCEQVAGDIAVYLLVLYLWLFMLGHVIPPWSVEAQTNFSIAAWCKDDIPILLMGTQNVTISTSSSIIDRVNIYIHNHQKNNSISILGLLMMRSGAVAYDCHLLNSKWSPSAKHRSRDGVWSGSGYRIPSYYILNTILVGGWATPLKNMNVNWDD